MRRGRLRGAAALLILAGAACSSETGSGNIVTRKIDVTSFSRLEVTHAFTVNVSVGSSEQVTVRVDDNLVDLLDAAVSDDTLHIGLEPATSVSNATLEADVTVRSLDAVEVAGSSTITLSDAVASDTLSVTVSGASRVTGRIEIDEGNLELSGASEATLSGSAATLEVTLSGASLLGTTDLTIDELSVDLSGASQAEVTVTGALSARASGASMLRYAGSPTVSRSETSGASTIAPVG